MTDEDDLFSFSIMEHICGPLYGKNPPVKEGFLIGLAFREEGFLIEDYSSFILSTPDTISDTSLVIAD